VAELFNQTISAVAEFFSPSSGVSDIGNAYKVTPAQSYRLTTGPSTSVNYVPQVGTIPIIGSDVTARAYSPFTFSILPPLLYLQNPDLLFGQGAERQSTIANGKPLPPLDLGIIGKSSIRNITDFRSTVTRLRGLSQQGANLTRSGGLTPPGQQPRTAVGGRVTNRPLGGSGGGLSSTDNQKITYAISDQQSAQDIANQLNRILNVPPLTLYVNPTQMQTTFGKVQQYTERSRYGYIYQTWGEEQVKLSVSAKIGAFLAGRSGAATYVADGVQFAAKRNSASFQQLMNLLTFYKNNGYIYDTITKVHTPQMIGIVSIEYDQNTYLGYFDSFSWGYTEQNQNGGIEFSFEFTVTQQYDNAQSNTVSPLVSPIPSPSDPRYGPRTDLSIGSNIPLGSPPPPPSTLLAGPQQPIPVSAPAASSPSLTPRAGGFRAPQVPAPPPPNTVPLQPFFDPRTV